MSRKCSSCTSSYRSTRGHGSTLQSYMATGRSRPQSSTSIQQRPGTVPRMQVAGDQHQQLHTAQERQLQLEAQALQQAQTKEQQAAAFAREHELAIQEFKRQAEEQSELLKLQWRRQLFLNSPRTRLRSTSSTPRCSTCVRSLR